MTLIWYNFLLKWCNLPQPYLLSLFFFTTVTQWQHFTLTPGRHKSLCRYQGCCERSVLHGLFSFVRGCRTRLQGATGSYKPHTTLALGPTSPSSVHSCHVLSQCDLLCFFIFIVSHRSMLCSYELALLGASRLNVCSFHPGTNKDSFNFLVVSILCTPLPPGGIMQTLLQIIIIVPFPRLPFTVSFVL